MKTYKELETLGFFDWFGNEHYSTVEDVDDLDNLTIDDIRLTTLNAAIFRWFREKHQLKGYIEPVEYLDNTPETYMWVVYDKCHSDAKQLTYEQAEQECLKQLIKIVKDEQ